MSDKDFLECAVYRSSKKDETYVFIPTSTPLSDLPEPVIQMLGNAELAMTLEITADKKLARCKGEEVLASIKKQGFHLQMPENPQLNANPLPTSNERFLDKNL